MITIYGLTDEFGQIRYIGQTSDPVTRFMEHKYKRRHYKLGGFATLAKTKIADEANHLEAKWIAYFGIDNLDNERMGGGRSIGVLSLKSQRKVQGYIPIELKRRMARITKAASYFTISTQILLALEARIAVMEDRVGIKNGAK